MTDKTTIEALSPAAFAHYLEALPHETRAIVTATERGIAWATVNIHAITDTRRSVFPAYSDGLIGDTDKIGQSGVMLNSLSQSDTSHALNVVIERARRMGLNSCPTT